MKFKLNTITAYLRNKHFLRWMQATSYRAAITRPRRPRIIKTKPHQEEFNKPLLSGECFFTHWEKPEHEKTGVIQELFDITPMSTGEINKAYFDRFNPNKRNLRKRK